MPTTSRNDALPVRLPPSSTTPQALTALGFLINRRGSIDRAVTRYGRCFAYRIPVFGNTVVVADPALAKQVFTTGPDVLHNAQPNCSASGRCSPSTVPITAADGDF